MPPRAVHASPSRWAHLAEFVSSTRENLGLTQKQAVARSEGGISLAVWSILENAAQRRGTMTAKSLRGASVALGLPPGFCEHVVSTDPDLQEMRSLLTHHVTRLGADDLRAVLEFTLSLGRSADGDDRSDKSRSAS